MEALFRRLRLQFFFFTVKTIPVTKIFLEELMGKYLDGPSQKASFYSSIFLFVNVSMALKNYASRAKRNPTTLVRRSLVKKLPFDQTRSQEFENGGETGKILDQCTDKMLATYRQM